MTPYFWSFRCRQAHSIEITLHIRGSSFQTQGIVGWKLLLRPDMMNFISVFSKRIAEFLSLSAAGMESSESMSSTSEHRQIVTPRHWKETGRCIRPGFALEFCSLLLWAGFLVDEISTLWSDDAIWFCRNSFIAVFLSDRKLVLILEVRRWDLDLGHKDSSLNFNDQSQVVRDVLKLYASFHWEL